MISEGWSQQTHGGGREASVWRGGEEAGSKWGMAPLRGRGCAGGRFVAGRPERDRILQVYMRLRVWLGWESPGNVSGRSREGEDEGRGPDTQTPVGAGHEVVKAHACHLQFLREAREAGRTLSRPTPVRAALSLRLVILFLQWPQNQAQEDVEGSTA